MSRRPHANNGRLSLLLAALPLAFCAGIATADEPARITVAGTAALAVAKDSEDGALRASHYEPIVVRVILDKLPRGDATVLRIGETRVLVKLADALSWGLQPARSATIRIGPDDYVDLASLPAISAVLDTRVVTLEIDAPPGALATTRIAMRSGRNPNVEYPQQPSAFLTYALTTEGTETFESPTMQALAQAGVRFGDFLLYQSSSYLHAASVDRFVRNETNLTYDNRASLQRLVIGDLSADSGALGSNVNLGGIGFSKVYAMDPYFIQYPTANLRGQVTTPSEVDVKVNGITVARRQIPPGPFELSAIQGVYGDRNVTLVVRDAFGHEQVLQQRFYYTDQALAQGLQQYSYNVGALRRDTSGNDYGPLAASAYHRYAFTDEVSAGLRGEAASGLVNAGAFATFLSPLFGIAGLGIAASSRHGQTGSGVDLFQSYVTDPLQLSIAAQYLTRNFATLTSTPDAPERFNGAFSIGTNVPAFGSIAAGYLARSRYDGSDERAASVSYSRQLGGVRSGFLTLSYQRGFTGVARNTLFLNVTVFLDRDFTASLNASKVDSHAIEQIELTKNLPIGEGLGYRVGVAAEQTPQGNGAGFDGGFDYNGTFARAGASLRTATVSGDRGTASAYVTGSVGYVNGRYAVSRPFEDSFAIVKIGDVPNIPVSLNGSRIGETDARGEIAVPSMLSFYDAYLTFDDSKLPIGYAYERNQRVVSPPLRSGTFVAFDVHKVHGVAGVLRYADGSPAEFREFVLRNDTASVASFTASKGQFYVDSLQPGSYALRTTDPGIACEAQVSIRDSESPVEEIGAVVCGAD